MSTIAILVAGAVATYVLRILFVTVVPAAQLPGVVRESLDHVGPAVLAALVAVALVSGARSAPGVEAAAPVLAALIAGAVAWKTRNLLATTALGITAVALLSWVLA